MSATSAENLLRASAPALHALLEQPLVGVAEADTRGRVLTANSRLSEMLDVSLDQVVKLTVDDLVRPDWITTVQPLNGADGQSQGLVVFVLDVTEQKRVQRQAELLSELGRRLARSSNEREILQTALEAVAALLQVGRAFFAEGHEAENRVILSASWPADQVPRAPHAFEMDELGAAGWWREYSRGDVAVKEWNAALEPPTQLAAPSELLGANVRAYAVQALERETGSTATLTVADTAPRAWRDDELRLLADILTRVWPLVERARTEASLSAALRVAQARLVERRPVDEKHGAADELASRFQAEAGRSRRSHEVALSSTPDMICVLDLQHRFTYANPALLDAWGRSWREVEGKTFLQAGYPDWHAGLHDRELRQVISTGRAARGEVPFRGRDGERTHDYIFVPVLGAGGEVEAVVGTTRDITTLKQSEYSTAGQAMALESMAKGESLPKVLEALCEVIDRQATERVYASIQLMQDDGQHLRPVAGGHMPATWAHAVDRWTVGPGCGACGTAAFERRRIVSQDIASDALWPEELKALAALHGFRACWSTPILSSGGAVLGTLALYYPCTHQPTASEVRLVEMITRTAGIVIERRRGEEGLRTHSERLRLLWEAAAVLLTTDDPEALIRALFVPVAPHLGLDVFLNHMLDESGELLKLFSFAGVSAEIAGDLATIHVESPWCGDATRTREPYSASFLQSSGAEEHQLLKAIGLRAYACVPLVAGDRLLGTLSFGSRQRDVFEADEVEFMRTVTRYLTVAYERLRLVRELREADRKKDDFIALLAHELRNPLAPLRNGLSVMRLASSDSAAVGRARTIMERQLSHMVRLIDDLLDVSRISLNKMLLRRARVTVRDVITSAVETARPAIDAAEHELVVAFPGEPIVLDADLTRLAQVFGNLLTNAAKYTPKRGRIAIRAKREADTVIVSVEDNGIGLRPESLRSIFGMFSQVDHSVERTTGGLGIGLALVKGLTEMHGGSVRAESAGPGRGSCFTVCLPLATATPEQGATPETSRKEKARRRILLVDDNRDAAESLATTLRLSGNEVHIAYDGIEGVERAEAVRPEVILMDVGMPRLNGYDATSRIRSHAWGKSMVVIALTGWGQESDRRQSREAGCDEHIVKPVEPAHLEELIDELCLSALQRHAVGDARRDD